MGIASRKLPQVGVDPQIHVRHENIRAEDEDEADHDEQQLRCEVDDCEGDVERRGLANPDDVHRHEHDDHEIPTTMSHGFVPERLPEDREVMRDEEGRDRDGDDVIQQLRPRGAEADRLVERVPGEARRASRLRIANRPLGVGHRRAGEDQSRDHEDDRRQPQREDSGNAERVVDRGADVAVDGREERGAPRTRSSPCWRRRRGTEGL